MIKENQSAVSENSNTALKPLANSGLLLLIILLCGVGLPFILIFIEKLLPNSVIITEELSKAVIVYFLISPSSNINKKLMLGVLFGITFGVAENTFYFMNFINGSSFDLFWARFLWPLPMHMITVLLMVLSGLNNKRSIYLGLIAAILLHFVYNNCVTTMIFQSNYLGGILKYIKF